MTKHQTETVHEHIDRVSDEAALKIMSEILRVVRDRGNVGDAAFERLTRSDVEDFYNSLIAPGIDIIEARMCHPSGCALEH